MQIELFTEDEKHSIASMTQNCLLCAVPGLAIKMQPFIDSDAWVYGVVQSVDKDWIYVLWHDKQEVLQHYHYEVECWFRHST